MEGEIILACSFSKYLLSAFCVSGIVSGACVPSVSNRSVTLALGSLYSSSLITYILIMEENENVQSN